MSRNCTPQDYYKLFFTRFIFRILKPVAKIRCCNSWETCPRMNSGSDAVYVFFIVLVFHSDFLKLCFQISTKSGGALDAPLNASRFEMNWIFESRSRNNSQSSFGSCLHGCKITGILWGSANRELSGVKMTLEMQKSARSLHSRSNEPLKIQFRIITRVEGMFTVHSAFSCSPLTLRHLIISARTCLLALRRDKMEE